MTIVVGVLNVTPDSFYDGGRFLATDAAVEAGLAMVMAGAGWIDVGGESTRPNAPPVSADEECARVVPVIEKLAGAVRGRARISIDTYKSATAKAALVAGASIVNDISGGGMDPAILKIAAAARAGIVLGHMRGTPATMMKEIHFTDAVRDVAQELCAAVAAARAAGCEEIWADPGIGFGKNSAHNLAILRGLPDLRRAVGVPVMVGVSHKRFIGDLTGKLASERIFGTAAAVAAAVLGGAGAVRVHDVAQMRDVVLVADAIAGDIRG